MCAPTHMSTKARARACTHSWRLQVAADAEAEAVQEVEDGLDGEEAALWGHQQLLRSTPEGGLPSGPHNSNPPSRHHPPPPLGAGAAGSGPSLTPSSAHRRLLYQRQLSAEARLQYLGHCGHQPEKGTRASSGSSGGGSVHSKRLRARSAAAAGSAERHKVRTWLATFCLSLLLFWMPSCNAECCPVNE